MSLIGVILLLTSPAAPAQQIFASNVARVYVDEAADLRSMSERSSAGPPSNVPIPRAFPDDVDAMLRSSPTFRAQCARIANATHLRVVLQLSAGVPSQTAVTRITRQPEGRLEAEVEIGPLGDPMLLIAHEFEHSIEQLDDVDLTALAERQGSGVRSDPKTGHFETERAIAIGRRVAREVSGAVVRR